MFVFSFVFPMLRDDWRRRHSDITFFRILSMRNTNFDSTRCIKEYFALLFQQKLSVMAVKTVVLFSPHLTDILNLTLFTGSYPECIKFAIVKCVYKDDDKSNLSNYRPVLPIINKVFELIKTIFFMQNNTVSG